jgi:ketol-acid reductoisomerase
MADTESETTIYDDEDADLSVLDDRTVAFVGYGNQGRSQALNARDSGVDVVVGNRDDGYREQIREDDFEPLSIAEATARGDVICLLVPDEVAPEVFESHVEPNLDEGDTLYVSHGYNLTYDLLGHPGWVDVVMVAPRMGGPAVRTLYKSGQGFPSILAVEQDFTGEALDTVLAMAKAIGSTGAGVVEGTADMETITDLLTEQALFPIIANAMLAKFRVEVAHGIPPEIVMSELYLSHEFAEIFEEMARHGYLGQLPFHSPTSQYGQLSRMDRFDEAPLVEWFEEQLQHVDDGGFAREWSAEQSLDRPGLKRLYGKYEDSEFFEAERRTMERLNLSAAAESEPEEE